MLVEFSVENYLSFKDKVTFSMVASDDTCHEETNIITLADGKRYLKSAVIYGANASGKSNLMTAMGFMSNFVYLSQERKPDEPINVETFALSANCKNEPTRFDVVFYKGGVKYAYGLTLTAKDVLEEYLYRFEGDKQRTIFERENITEYTFNDEYGENEDAQVLEYFRKFTANNKPYLSVAVMLNYTPVMDAYNWIEDLYQYTNITPYNILRRGYFDANADSKKADSIVKTAVEWLKKVDVGITGIKINEDKELFKDDYFNNGKYTWDNYVKILNNIISTHESGNGDGVREKVDFKFYSSESAGTQTFFSLALAIADKMARGGVFLKDELNSALHTLLSKHVVEIFNNADESSQSQLIFTTHDTNLLDLDLFRRDQIWFTEKHPDTGATGIFSLHDFGDRVDVDVEKGYLLGIYGAIPFIGGADNA
ncbi:MAG: ATP-binding protein [Defluviitaleaceae bacterium]|nr:ATP-binding protein [Defluviitaleaceae bacterium]